MIIRLKVRVSDYVIYAKTSKEEYQHPVGSMIACLCFQKQWFAHAQYCLFLRKENCFFKLQRVDVTAKYDL